MLQVWLCQNMHVGSYRKLVGQQCVEQIKRSVWFDCGV